MYKQKRKKFSKNFFLNNCGHICIKKPITTFFTEGEYANNLPCLKRFFEFLNPSSTEAETIHKQAYSLFPKTEEENKIASHLCTYPDNPYPRKSALKPGRKCRRQHFFTFYDDSCNFKKVGDLDSMLVKKCELLAKHIDKRLNYIYNATELLYKCKNAYWSSYCIGVPLALGHCTGKGPTDFHPFEVIAKRGQDDGIEAVRYASNKNVDLEKEGYQTTWAFLELNAFKKMGEIDFLKEALGSAIY